MTRLDHRRDRGLDARPAGTSSGDAGRPAGATSPADVDGLLQEAAPGGAVGHRPARRHRQPVASGGRRERGVVCRDERRLRPGLDSELETRTIRVAEFKTRRSRPSAGRAISRRFITPAPHPSPSKRVEGPWMVTLRPDAKARFTIHLGGETARTILAEVADVSHEGLETGGLLFSSCCSRQPRGRGLGSCSASAC